MTADDSLDDAIAKWPAVELPPGARWMYIDVKAGEDGFVWASTDGGLYQHMLSTDCALVPVSAWPALADAPNGILHLRKWTRDA